MLYSIEYASPVGRLTLAGSETHLTGLWIDGQKYFGRGAGEVLVPVKEYPLLDQARRWLDRYFDGKRPSPEELPLSPHGSPFRQRVWEALCKIPYGQTLTYGELAQALGTAPRALGNAVGHNPISIIIPCHRVIGAGGSLTGYAGGIEVKRKLLLHEGIGL